jgi:hypothetical protein
MLLNREPIERDLIYHVCKLEDEYRVAIIMAYQIIQDKND